MEDDLNYVITEEERTRHDALFYSQSPKNGLLSGEQARSLFIRSRLPLSELSKIWKLADITRDNMLDVSEFATAMHLIQLRLRGFNIPEKLPPSLTPTKITITNIPAITGKEIEMYQKTFEWKDKDKTGYIDTEAACNIMLTSRLESHVLAQIWDLSDLDRDAKFSNTEFAIALHLLRFCKKGHTLEGSIDVKSALPQELLKDDGEAKKKRHTEVQTERRQLWTLKQKLCSEMVGLDQKVVDENIRPELIKVEERLATLEKEETELRRSLLNLKDKSKKESFKPFDRSFLLKKRVSGCDLFKGDRQSYLGKEGVSLFEKLWTSDELLDESAFSNTEEESDCTTSRNGVDNELSQDQPTEIIFTEVKRDKNTVGGLVNGLDSVDNSIHSGYRQDGDKRVKSSENNLDFSKSSQSSEGIDSREAKKVARNESFSWAAIQRRPVIQQTVTEEVLEMPEKKGDVPVDEVVSVEQKERNSDLEEQLKLLEKDSHNHVDINQNSGPSIEHGVSVQTVERVESSHQDFDTMFNQFSRDHSKSTGNEKVCNKKLPVGRVLSDEEEKELIESGALKRAERQCHPRYEPTQEELLPMYIQEKRHIEEERKKKREIEGEKIRQAREELKRRDEESKQQLALRKASIQEAKGKLEKQISQSEHIVPKAGNGRLIEQDKIRDKKANIRIQQVSIGSREPNPEDEGTKGHHQFNKPVLRRQKHEETAKTGNNRKSWVELEIEQQKLKDEEMRREREERQKDLDRLAQGNKQPHGIKDEVTITEEPVVKSSFKGSVESRPGMFSKPPATLGVTKPDGRKPSNVPTTQQSIQPKESTRSNTSANGLFNGIGGSGKTNEAESERRIQEEEERRRLEQIEKVRQDSLKREAEELVRKRDIREEEIRKRRELHLRESEKIKKEEQERREEEMRNAEHRRLKFEVEKIRLEERVIKTMKEAQSSDITSRVRTPSSSSDTSKTSQITSPPPPPEEQEVHERRKSVRDAKALFERPKEQPKAVVRQKRQSLNLDDTAAAVKPSRNPNRASFYSDAVVSKEMKTTNAIEIIPLDDQGPDEKPASRLVLGNIKSKRQQYETRQPSADSNQPVIFGKSEKKESQFSSTISNNKIQQEMAEHARKEEEIRLRKEQRLKASSNEQDSLDGIKKNPLPSKMQVKQAAPRPPFPKQEPQQKPVSNKNPPVKKMSFIEMEKEKERQREEALKREREAIIKEREMMQKQKDPDQSKDDGKKKPATGGWQYK